VICKAYEAGTARKQRGSLSPSHSSSSLHRREEKEEDIHRQKSIRALENLGVSVLLPPKALTKGESNEEENKKEEEEERRKQHSWDDLAGYQHIQQAIQDRILLPLVAPELFDAISRQTRTKFESNQPRAVLFYGPPGTGKTTAAKIIASEEMVGLGLIHVPLEAVFSKWVGESEKNLSQVLDLARELGMIVFIDEIDALATSRDGGDGGGGGLHEVTRKTLGVLLCKLDGMDSSGDSSENKLVVIAATNRKQDLDPALLSRFDVMIHFPLPDQTARRKIWAFYAKHLSKQEVDRLASGSKGMSARSIKDTCQNVERSCAAKMWQQRGSPSSFKRKGTKSAVSVDELPTANDYLKQLVSSHGSS